MHNWRNPPRSGTKLAAWPMAGAIAVALALLAALADPGPAAGQTGQLELATVNTACSPGGVRGTVAITNSANTSLTGRLRLFLAARTGDSGPWVRFGGEQFAKTFDTGPGTTLDITYGPLETAAAPAGSTAVRVEAALDAVTVDPAGSTVVVWDIDQAAATTSCALALPASIAGPLVYAAGFGGSCGPTAFAGQLTLANRGSYPQDVKADVSLARLDGGAWILVDGLRQTFSTTIEPGASVSIPLTFPLAGMVADTPAVRIEALLTAIDFVAGQARRTQESAAGPAMDCPPAPGAPGKEKYTVALGDTLASVANAHKVSAEELAAANGLDVAARLLIGQSLTIPKTAVKPVTTTTSGSSRRGTVAPGEPVVRPTKTPSPTAEPTATEEPTPKATKTAIPGATTGSGSEPSNPGGGQGPGDGDPAGESSGGGVAAMLVPVGLGLVAIFVAGGSALGAVLLLRKLRGRPRGPANAPAGMAAAAPSAMPPQQPVPAPPAQTKKPGTREDPAAIPLSGDMRDLLGIERNRTAVAKAFVPDPAAVAPGRAILEEAREVARALGRVA